jgi:phage I-like protein
MADQTITLFTALPAADAAGAGALWLHLVPAGICRAADGRGPFNLADAPGVIAASMADGPLAVDVNHATDHAAKTGGDAPAHGWIVEMAQREDGIWGRVDWNPSGQQLLANRSYRGVSPVIIVNKQGAITRILRAALTNTPALPMLASLFTTQDHTVDNKQLRTALALPEDAAEETVLATLTAAVSARSATADLVARAAAAAGVSAATPEALVIALTAQRATAVPNETVVQLQAQLATLTAQRAGDSATRFIDAAIAAGKPIVASRDKLIALHAQNAGLIEEMVNAMLSLNAGGVTIERLAMSDDEDALTDTEMATCKKMNLDPKEFAKMKKKQREAKRGAA